MPPRKITPAEEPKDDISEVDSQYEGDDFDEDAHADAAGHASTAIGLAALRELQAMVSAPSNTARFASAANALRVPAFRFNAPPTEPSLNLPVGFNLFPAVPLAAVASQAQDNLDIDTGLGEDVNHNAYDDISSEEEPEEEDERDVRMTEEVEVPAFDYEADQKLDDDKEDLDSDAGDLDAERELDEREGEDARNKFEELDQEMQRRKKILNAADAPIPAPNPAAVYVSPFAAAVAGADDEEERRYDLAEKRDMELYDFLHDVALNLPAGLIPMLRDSFRITIGKFKELPGFRVNVIQLRITLVNPIAITSLSPNIFMAATTRSDGAVIHHLEALIAYCFASQGRVKYMYKRIIEDGRNMFSFEDLLGADPEDGSFPRDARSVKQPGVYGINPLDVFLIVGMSFSLGISRRTSRYLKKKYPIGSKMGLVQKFVDEKDGMQWPGKTFAIMYHDQKIAYSKIAIPAGAVYGAESLMIVMLGANAATPEDIEDVLDVNDGELRPAGEVQIVEDQVTSVHGLNTNIADIGGAFERQWHGLGIAGARAIVNKILYIYKKNKLFAFPEYHYRDENHVDNPKAAAFYLRHFGKLMPPNSTLRRMYVTVRFRTLDMRRALFDSYPLLGSFTGDTLPGVNPLLAFKPLWLKMPGRDQHWS